jgi:hypothetical protein
MNVDIICSEEQGYWTAIIQTDGQHDQIVITDGSEYIEVLPVDDGHTDVIWSAANDLFPGKFWVGYDQYDMTKVITSQCGTPVIHVDPNPQPTPIIITPPAPPPTDTVIPVGDGAVVIPNLLIFIAVIALSMRVIARRFR